MKHKTTARYPVPSAIVIKMFTDKKFHTDKLEAMGLKNSKVLDHKSDGKSFSIKVERKVPMDAPGIIKKFVPAETTVAHEEQWVVATKTGMVKVQPQGIPVEISCAASMADEGSGCVVSYTWDIAAKVPFVGGALEKFVASDLDKRLDEETRAAVSLAKNYK